MINLYTKEVEGVWFGVAFREEEIYATTFASSRERALKSLRGSIPFDVSFQHMENGSTFAESVLAMLKDVYDGKDAPTKVSLATDQLPKYTSKVLKAAYKIPTGYVTSYGGIAKAVGGGPRAVGNVMAMNPFAPIVPCHRVVAWDLTLGGYGGGLATKLQFLKREKRGFTSRREIPVEGGKLVVFPVESVLEKAAKK